MAFHIAMCRGRNAKRLAARGHRFILKPEDIQAADKPE
jgi:hypothetical protein